MRSATLTTVPSNIAMPEPSVAAAMTARPTGVPIRTAEVSGTVMGTTLTPHPPAETSIPTVRDVNRQ
ncbi:hypothetical protein GCM10009798_44200 [Nocardioides panacihumi]|uniref:Uncharacterized protein n=1 Tax=Nocardioides panacihumi TaxID=400774 RepID=A0ABN2S1I6_9ACTN